MRHTHIVNSTYNSSVFLSSDISSALSFSPFTEFSIFAKLFTSRSSCLILQMSIFYGLLLVMCPARVLIVLRISILFSFSCTFLFFFLAIFSFTLFFIGA